MLIQQQSRTVEAEQKYLANLWRQLIRVLHENVDVVLLLLCQVLFRNLCSLAA